MISCVLVVGVSRVYGAPRWDCLQSKFDQALWSSKSVFVSNFPEGCTPKDIWKVCNDYDIVVDVFIPNKKSKTGKRFAFVRFIKYALGKVKDVNSIPNLRTLLMDEGFSDVKLKYLGGMWVVFEFDKVDTKVNMMQHIVVKLWFHVIQDALHDFVSDERIVWVDIERIPLNVWSRETLMRTGKKWGEMLDIEDNVDSSFGRKRLCIKTKQPEMVYASEDESVHSPKKIPAHSSFSEEVSGDDSESDVEEVSETILGDNSSSLNNNSDEIGFTPEVSEILKENDQGAEEFSSLVNAKVMNNSQELYQEINKESVDPNVVKEGGFVLGVLEDMIQVGQAMRVFDHFISSSGLIDVKLEGYAFIWSHLSGSKMSKLDRFLVSEGLFGFWFDSLSVLSLMVQLGGFDVMVEQTWHSFSHSDVNRMIRFKKKLQDLKAIIRCWVKDKRMHRSGEKISIKNELSDINKEVDRGMEAKDSFQKSKIKWAIEGDENSKFFHGIINKKHSQLAIRGVFDNGLWCTDPGKVKEAFFNHFEARFKKPVAHRFMLNFPFNKRLSDMQAADLERNMSRDEIRLAVWNCGENKSPGPDGYTFEFFRKYWNIVGPDFCEAVEYFFETGLFSKGCKSSFVALILKVTDAKFVNDFRPISLIESVYKVVTKIIANRLALVIADLVFDT
nr:RNA-directed DNA polymerase, eukaryota [Tanacetum cinerariifolium]